MPDFAANAYAKINLTLDVTGTRPDGYHTLRSVFQSVTLFDRIFLTKESGGKIDVSCNRPDLSCGRDNTVRRAAEVFFGAAEIPNPGISFRVEKRIPWQAGLGGGSADAAAALLLLNRMFSNVLSEQELSASGLKVGADVPFCLVNGTALAEGIGERLTALPPLPPCQILLCKPSAGIGTKEAYQALDKKRYFADRFTGPMLRALRVGKWNEITDCVGNVFEPLASIPEILQIKRHMTASGAAAACMTGTGSAVFGLFQKETQARACADELSRYDTDCFLCEPYHP
ncbi:MAG: 4-(cytidine 5'-diphospho)-2-C-methyl-D-erythritol kinase [Oscillospiraceae bacterium]|jgi:4-diphosphocytidyl-2-C-methyl-D-erythritol kinase|nr:4-(cytidine 5'-diphospho)-2-C-methyl-D-erythritol kinase [Oscillospiraceae bacterium]